MSALSRTLGRGTITCPDGQVRTGTVVDRGTGRYWFTTGRYCCWLTRDEAMESGVQLTQLEDLVWVGDRPAIVVGMGEGYVEVEVSQGEVWRVPPQAVRVEEFAE